MDEAKSKTAERNIWPKPQKEVPLTRPIILVRWLWRNQTPILNVSLHYYRCGDIYVAFVTLETAVVRSGRALLWARRLTPWVGASRWSKNLASGSG